MELYDSNKGYVTTFYGGDCTHSVGYASTDSDSTTELTARAMEEHNIIPGHVGSLVITPGYSVTLYDYDGYRG